MNHASAAAWETRHALRQLIPWSWARGLLVVLTLAFEAWLFVFVFFLKPPSRPLEVGVVGGFVGFNLLLASGAAGVALSRLLAQPERLGLLRSSPMGPRAALGVALMPTLLAALCPLTLLGLPFALMAARRSPPIAASMLVAGGCALGWAMLAAVSTAAFLGRRFGRERGARVLGVLSGWMAFVVMMGFGALVRLELGAPTLVLFLVLTPLLLPALWSRALESFLDVLQDTHSPRSAPEPVWGAPGWGRLARRSAWGPARFAGIPALVVGVGRPELRCLLCALLAVQGVSGVLDRVLEPELAAPDRLRLAPRGALLRARLLCTWGSAALAPALALCAAVGWERWHWLTSIAGAGLLVPFTYLARSRGIRVAGQLALLAGALTASMLWGR